MKTSRPGVVAVIGLGYVGLPLAVHLVQKGFTVRGIDKDQKKLRMIENGRSYIPDIADATIKQMNASNQWFVSDSYLMLRDATHIIVAVPTPLQKQQLPDLRWLHLAIDGISQQLQPGQTIILESSTYPGTLQEEVRPRLELPDRIVGQDFYLGYSPERIDPGNMQYTLENIPKVVSGCTPACLAHVRALYDQLFTQTVPVSEPSVAECSKLFENIQRLVNISLVNELDVICRKMNIDFREALQAAATKPFGYMPYWPGPGIGGHCIPVDPVYFQWKSQQWGLKSRLIDVALQVNRQMPDEIVRRITHAIQQRSQRGKPNILLIGLAYKKDVNDLRESVAIPIFRKLLRKGWSVEYHDPYIPDVQILGKKYISRVLNKDTLQQADAVVILTDHSNIDWNLIAAHASVVIDTRGIHTLRQKGMTG